MGTKPKNHYNYLFSTKRTMRPDLTNQIESQSEIQNELFENFENFVQNSDSEAELDLELIMQEQAALVIENSTFETSKRPLIRNKNSTKFDSADHFMKQQQLEKIIEEQSDKILENSTFESNKRPLIKNKNPTKFDSADHFMKQQQLEKIVEEQQKFLENMENM